MKKRIVVRTLLRLTLIWGALVFYGSTSWADQGKTEAGIKFEQTEDTSHTEPPTYEPKPPGGLDKEGTLPHLGQMVTSCILLLSGVSCLIVSIGIIGLRRVYMNEQ